MLYIAQATILWVVKFKADNFMPEDNTGNHVRYFVNRYRKHASDPVEKVWSRNAKTDKYFLEAEKENKGYEYAGKRQAYVKNRMTNNDHYLLYHNASV